jgi:flagellar motor switch protein FliN/FliY
MSRTAVNPIEYPEAEPAAGTGPALVGKDLGLVGHVNVNLSALVGTVSMSIEQLFAIKQGEVLTMNESCDAPITLLLNGKAVARGELVAVEDHFGIRITELS